MSLRPSLVLARTLFRSAHHARLAPVALRNCAHFRPAARNLSSEQPRGHDEFTAASDARKDQGRKGLRNGRPE